MKIKVQSIWGAEPQMCLNQCRETNKSLRRQEGLRMEDQGHSMRLEARENHCVWENPAGVLFDVTPEFADVSGGFAIAEWSDECEFERDDSSTFEGKNRPGQYIPPGDNPHLKNAAEYVLRGDMAMNVGDLDAAATGRTRRTKPLAREVRGRGGTYQSRATWLMLSRR